MVQVTTMPNGPDWTQPGVEEVAAGVYRIPLPLPGNALRAVNVYAIRHADGALTMIDSGWSTPEARSLLLDNLAQLGNSITDVDRFLVTHVHRDHYTLAIALRREFGTRVAIGKGEQPALRRIGSPDHRPMQEELARLRRSGASGVARELARQIDEEGFGKLDPADWEIPDQWLEPATIGAGGRMLEVVETPGHTQGHVVFHDVAAGLLFAGDHVLPVITPSIGFEGAVTENPLGAFLRSLALVRSRPDARLLPAHGPADRNAHARVDELIDHHGRRLELMESALASGASTACEVAQQVRWTRRQVRFGELSVFNQMLAIGETSAHLALLIAQGRAASSETDGVVRYACTTSAANSPLPSGSPVPQEAR